MNGPNDKTAWKSLRAWWANPPRSGLARWLAPWEYRHLRGWATVRIASGLVSAGLGVFVLSQVRDAWVIFGVYLLAAGVGNIVLACWELNIADSAAAQA